MIRYESQCVSCGFPCRYGACPNYRVKILECDVCHEECEKLYVVDGDELCEYHALQRLEVVE